MYPHPTDMAQSQAWDALKQPNWHIWIPDDAVSIRQRLFSANIRPPTGATIIPYYYYYYNYYYYAWKNA